MTGEPDEDPTVDLAAILRSERELSELSERRAPDGTEEPLSLLAALAADVDDSGEVAASPGDLPVVVPEGTGPVRPVRGRRWVAAALGLAATVVGTTGVAAAGTHGFPPVSALFGAPSPSSAAAGQERPESEPPATTAPGTRAPRYPSPGRTPSEPPFSRLAPDTRTPSALGSPAQTGSAPEPPRTKSARPSPSPSDRADRTSSGSPSPSDSTTPTNDDRTRRQKGLERLNREIDRLTRRPGDS